MALWGGWQGVFRFGQEHFDFVLDGVSFFRRWAFEPQDKDWLGVRGPDESPTVRKVDANTIDIGKCISFLQQDFP